MDKRVLKYCSSDDEDRYDHERPMDMTAIVDIRKSKHDRASLMLQLFLQDITIGFLTGLVFK